MRSLFIVILLHSILSIGNGQQYATLLMNRDNGDGIMDMNDESKVHAGYLLENMLIMEEQNANMDVRLQLEILSGMDPVDEYTVSLKNPNGSIYYGYGIESGELFIKDIVGTVPLGPWSGPLPVIEVIRCEEKIYYVFDGVIILCRNADSTIDLFGVVEVEDAEEANIDVDINLPDNCDYVCSLIQEQYVSLENFIEWREHILEDSIKIKYVEKYSIATGINDVVTCQIVNNQGDVVFEVDPPFDNVYGINLQSAPIPIGELIPGERYTMIVSGMNKGQVHKIRVRYDGD
jgi:hypothetical protein